MRPQYTNPWEAAYMRFETPEQEIKKFIRGNGASDGALVDPYKKKPGARVGAGSKGGTVTADRRRPR